MAPVWKAGLSMLALLAQLPSRSPDHGESGQAETGSHIQRRWPGDAPGTDTVTEYITLRPGEALPTCSPCTAPPGVVVVSVYTDAYTTMTLAPNWRTMTAWPTYTALATLWQTESHTTIAVTTQVVTATQTEVSQATRTVTSQMTTTETATSVSSAMVTTAPGSTSTQASLPTTRTTSTATTSTSRTLPQPTPTGAEALSDFRTCQPGDEQEEVPGRFNLTQDQRWSLYAIAAFLPYSVIAWHFVFLRDLTFPIKILAVAYHELGHVIGHWVSFVPVSRISIDPFIGGATLLGPQQPMPLLGIYGGPIFSVLTGGIFTVCGFDVYSSKIASIVLGVSWAAVLFFSGGGLIGRLSIVAMVGLMIGLWFVEHARALRFFVLFNGVVNAFYLLHDWLDDTYNRGRVHRNCAALMANQQQLGSPSGFGYFIAWMIISIGAFIGFVLGAIIHFRETPHAAFCRGQSFLAT